MSIEELISHKPVKIFSEADIIAKTLNTFVHAIIVRQLCQFALLSSGYICIIYL